jgi:bacteriocin-like protein
MDNLICELNDNELDGVSGGFFERFAGLEKLVGIASLPTAITNPPAPALCPTQEIGEVCS